VGEIVRMVKVKKSCENCGDETYCVFKRHPEYDKEMSDMLGLNSLADRCRNFIPMEGVEYE